MEIKQGKILYRGRFCDIKRIAASLCNDITRISDIHDTTDPQFPAVVRHMLTAIVPQKMSDECLVFDEEGFCEYANAHPFHMNADDPEYNRDFYEKKLSWDEFFRALSEDTLLTYRHELLILSPMAIRYIDTKTPDQKCPGENWSLLAVKHHPQAIIFIPEADRTPEIQRIAISNWPEAAEFLAEPTRYYTDKC